MSHGVSVCVSLPQSLLLPFCLSQSVTQCLSLIFVAPFLSLSVCHSMSQFDLTVCQHHSVSLSLSLSWYLTCSLTLSFYKPCLTGCNQGNQVPPPPFSASCSLSVSVHLSLPFLVSFQPFLWSTVCLTPSQGSDLE